MTNDAAGPPLHLNNTGRALRFLRTALGSVAAVRLAKTVLHRPAVLASVEGLVSAGPIVSAASVPSVPSIAVTLPSIPIPVPVAGPVVVIAISRSRVITEIKIDALRGRASCADDRTSHERKYRDLSHEPSRCLFGNSISAEKFHFPRCTPTSVFLRGHYSPPLLPRSPSAEKTSEDLGHYTTRLIARNTPAAVAWLISSSYRPPLWLAAALLAVASWRARLRPQRCIRSWP